MKKVYTTKFLAILLVLLFAGCGIAPIHNYNTPISPKYSNLSMDKIEKSILSAGTVLGWKMKKSNDGEIIGTLALRNHFAQVKVLYTTKSYQILYMKSTALNYNQEKNTIHNNYNGWVQNLNNGIQRNLTIY